MINKWLQIITNNYKKKTSLHQIHLPFYGRTIKLEIKEFTNVKLLFELQFFEISIKGKIKQLTTKALLQEQPFYKQPIKNYVLKSWKTMNYYVSYHFIMILIFQEKKGYLQRMSKPIK